MMVRWLARGAHSGVFERLGEDTGEQGSGGGGEGAGEGVPGEDGSSLRGRNYLRKGGLFDGKERAHLIAAGTDDADGGGDDEEQRVRGQRESDARARHQGGSGDEHFAAPDAIGLGGQDERDGGIAEQGEGKQEAGLLFAQAQAGEVEDEDYRQRPIREQAQKTGGEEQASVVGQRMVNQGHGWITIGVPSATRFQISSISASVTAMQPCVQSPGAGRPSFRP